MSAVVLSHAPEVRKTKRLAAMQRERERVRERERETLRDSVTLLLAP
jgi:hypothetical protein